MIKIKKIVYLFLFVSLLLVGSNVFAIDVDSYVRSPSGTSVESPITIDIDIGNACIGANYWKVNVFEQPFSTPATYKSPCYATSTPVQSWEVALPVDDYMGVSLNCYNADVSCLGAPNILGWLEYDDENTIFEVMVVGEYNILPVANLEVVPKALGYVARVFGDFSWLAYLWLGLVVGFIVIDGAIGIIRKRFK